MRCIKTGLLFLAAGLIFCSDFVQSEETQKPVRDDSALQQRHWDSPPPEWYRNPANIHYQTGAGIAIAPNGRLWVTIMTGGRTECPDNYVDLITSGDGGMTWSEPVYSLDIPGPMRTFDPAIWTDPDGRIWWFWCQLYDFWDGRGGIWTMVCDDPNRADAPWSEPRRLCDGVVKNKPLVTSDGTWLLLAETWLPGFGADSRKHYESTPWFVTDGVIIGPNVYASEDHGATWNYRSTVPIAENVRTCDEQMAVELKDGRIRNLLRTLYGIGESYSDDGGRTWTETTPSAIQNPPARFFFKRLESGNIILIKNGPLDVQTSRRDLTAYLSEDDGETFPYALLLDGREGCAYPDACEDASGNLFVVHDFDRERSGEIRLDRITEADIKAGKLVTEGSFIGKMVRHAENGVNK